MNLDVFWVRIECAMDYGKCDVCPVNEYAKETNTERMCDRVGDCADGLKMLHKKLQEEEREKQDSLNELPWRGSVKAMTKQELAHIARLMYDLQEYCGCEWDDFDESPCKNCPAGLNSLCDLFVACRGIPSMWGITKADIERLERESNAD